MKFDKSNGLLNSIILLGFTSCSVFASTTKYYEGIFATSVMLADSDTISLGMGNFDPDVLLKPNQHHLIDQANRNQSIQVRNQLSTFNIPYTFVLDENNKEFSDKIIFNASYIKQEKSHSAFDDTSLVPDDNLDKTYSAYLAYSKYLQISKHWKFRYRLGSYYMHYSNKHKYNNELSEDIRKEVDGIYFNTLANSFIIEPNMKFTYTQEKSWGKWQLNSNFSYFKGKVFSGAEASLDAKPSGWRVNNGVKVHFDVNTSRFHTESLYLKFQRVDIQGDMVSSLETDHFYEIGFGMLLDTRKFTDLAENIGIGININKGSSLYGGSIVFYFNEF